MDNLKKIQMKKEEELKEKSKDQVNLNESLTFHNKKQKKSGKSGDDEDDSLITNVLGEVNSDKDTVTENLINYNAIQKFKNIQLQQKNLYN